MDSVRYIVVEGPIGVGKSALAEKLAQSLEARLVLEETEANPFLEGFQKDRKSYAFQAQLFFLLSRFRQLQELTQLDLFHRSTVGDCLFERDRLFAMVSLDEDEFVLYDQVFGLLQDRVPSPDLVIYLSARAEVLWQRHRASGQEEGVLYSREYLEDLNEAFNHFFFHYNRSPLLVVNTSDVDLLNSGDDYRHFLREVLNHRKGTKHYIPLSSAAAS
jgi:deoxyguanosine kinase